MPCHNLVRWLELELKAASGSSSASLNFSDDLLSLASTKPEPDSAHFSVFWFTSLSLPRRLLTPSPTLSPCLQRVASRVRTSPSKCGSTHFPNQSWPLFLRAFGLSAAALVVFLDYKFPCDDSRKLLLYLMNFSSLRTVPSSSCTFLSSFGTCSPNSVDFL